MPMHPEYEERWLASGYDKTLGSVRVCPPPPSGFTRVYYLTTAEYALAAISLRRIKVSRLSQLNDPFEGLALRLKGKDRRQTMIEFKDALDKTHGMLCFSSNWTNPVLWTHYGNRHRGICLGFGLRESMAEKVIYTQERPQQELDGRKRAWRLTPGQKQHLRLTKFRHWEYEQEKRLFVDLSKAVKEGPLHYWKFDDDFKLAEVILGFACDLPLEEMRTSVSAHQGAVVTFKARLGVHHFEIVRDEATVP